MDDTGFDEQLLATIPDEPFTDVPLVADLPASEQTAALHRRDRAASGTLESTPPRRMRGISLNPFARRAFSVKEAIVGYVSDDASGDDRAVVHASAVEGDPSLARRPLTLTLDRFYVEEYPGLGTHQVLCTFTVGYLAKFDGQTGQPIRQDVTFGYAFPVDDRSAATISGMPIFRDLRIHDGLYMWISCINTNSRGDDALLQVLNGEPFGKGLQLLAATVPITGMLSSLVMGVARHFLNASRDALTFKPQLGLQVSGEQATAKLREGSYIVAQASAARLKWADYRWRRSEGRVVHAEQGGELPFNYFVISVRR